MSQCLHCRKETINPKFCCRSCSVSYNNSLRTLSETTINKISYSLRKHNLTKSKVPTPPKSVVYFKKCSCGINFFGRSPKTQYCHSCRNKIRIKNGIRSKHIVRNGIHLDSSWEVRIAEFLDRTNIEWIRPQFIYYYDKSGKIKKYFPDFYLPKYDLYLDPKNPYRMVQDELKMMEVSKKINVVYGDIKDILARLEGLEPSCVQINLSTGS